MIIVFVYSPVLSLFSIPVYMLSCVSNTPFPYLILSNARRCSLELTPRLDADYYYGIAGGQGS